jgi:hypothetical protein
MRDIAVVLLLGYLFVTPVRCGVEAVARAWEVLSAELPVVAQLFHGDSGRLARPPAPRSR